MCLARPLTPLRRPTLGRAAVWALAAALLAALVALALAVRPVPAAGQELGLFLGRGFSDFREMERPGSLALHARLPVPAVSALHLAGGYRRRWSNQERSGTICDSYWPGFEACTEETVLSRARVSQWEAGLDIGGEVRPALEVRGGVFRVASTLDASSRGAESGRGAGSYYPEGRVWSTAFTLGLAWTGGAGGRLGFDARARTERLDFDGCVTDVGTPFCGAERVVTLEVGVVVRRAPGR